MQGAVAEYERAKILERSRRGKLHAARRGSVSVLGRAPFGYRYVSKCEGGGEAHYNVDLPEARMVRQMFHWIGVERLSLQQVCRNLEKQGVLTAKGRKRWSTRSVWGILRNPAYKGMAGYGKRCSGPLRPRPRPRRGAVDQPRRSCGWYSMPQRQWVLVPVPAIVEEELFLAVAEQLEENKRRMREQCHGARYLLQGLLVCSCCGYAYCGLTQVGRRREHVDRRVDRNGGGYSYYRCIGTDTRRISGLGRRVCPNKPLRMEHLDEAVWRDVRSLLEDPARIEREFERRLHGKDSISNEEESRKWNGIIQKVRRGIARLIDAYRDGLLEKEEFEPRLSEARSRLAKLEAEIESRKAAESANRELRLVIANLQAFSQRVKSGLAEADWATKRELIRILVKRVEIDKEQVRVVYKVDIHPFEPAPKRGISKDCVLRQRATSLVAGSYEFGRIGI
jgi:site-specific DNA recombinase